MEKATTLVERDNGRWLLNASNSLFEIQKKYIKGGRFKNEDKLQIMAIVMEAVARFQNLSASTYTIELLAKLNSSKIVATDLKNIRNRFLLIIKSEYGGLDITENGWISRALKPREATPFYKKINLVQAQFDLRSELYEFDTFSVIVIANKDTSIPFNPKILTLALETIKASV